MVSKIGFEKSVTRYRSNDDESRLLQYANQNRNKGFFNDVKLNVNNQKISANRLVLSCYSDYFENILKSYIAAFPRIVTIENLDDNAVQIIIDYIYDGNIEINSTNVLNLLSAAHQFKLNDVKQFCSEFLETVITNDSCLYILDAAKQSQCFQIQLKVLQHLNENFDKVSRTQPFKQLSKTDLVYIISRINRDEVGENFIYHAIVTWTKYDEENRLDDFENLFPLVKLNNFSRDCMTKEVSELEFLMESVSCLSHHLNSSSRTINKKKPIKNERKILSFGGTKTPSKVIEIYNSIDEPVLQYPDLPLSLRGHCSLKLNKFVYCIGGQTVGKNRVSSNKVWRINLKEKRLQWKKVTAMTEKRELMSAAVYFDILVVSGGGDGKYISGSTEIFQETINQWIQISSTQQSRLSHAMVVCDGHLYVVGGYCCNPLSSVERLNKLSSDWENVGELLTPRMSLSAVNCKGIIYAIGGRSGVDDNNTILKSVEKFDYIANKWIYVSDMNIERSALSACVLHDTIFVVGGINLRGEVVKEIECYDPDVNKWTIVEKTKEELQNHSLVVI